jgi:hypothetical protein
MQGPSAGRRQDAAASQSPGARAPASNDHGGSHAVMSIGRGQHDAPLVTPLQSALVNNASAGSPEEGYSLDNPNCLNRECNAPVAAVERPGRAGVSLNDSTDAWHPELLCFGAIAEFMLDFADRHFSFLEKHSSGPPGGRNRMTTVFTRTHVVLSARDVLKQSLYLEQQCRTSSISPEFHEFS